MGVIPVRAGLVGDEPIGELTSEWHRVLGHPGYPVHGVGHVDAMPVQRDPIGDRLVAQMHLDQLTLPGADLRTRGGAIDAESGDGSASNGQHLLSGHRGPPLRLLVVPDRRSCR